MRTCTDSAQGWTGTAPSCEGESIITAQLHDSQWILILQLSFALIFPIPPMDWSSSPHLHLMSLELQLPISVTLGMD